MFDKIFGNEFLKPCFLPVHTFGHTPGVRTAPARVWPVSSDKWKAPLDMSRLILDEMCRLYGKFAAYFSSYK